MNIIFPLLIRCMGSAVTINVSWLQAVSSSPIGGEFLSECMMKSLESKGIVVTKIWWDLEFHVVSSVVSTCLIISLV